MYGTMVPGYISLDSPAAVLFVGWWVGGIFLLKERHHTPFPEQSQKHLFLGVFFSKSKARHMVKQTSTRRYEQI